MLWFGQAAKQAEEVLLAPAESAKVCRAGTRAAAAVHGAETAALCPWECPDIATIDRNEKANETKREWLSAQRETLPFTQQAAMSFLKMEHHFS